MKTTALNTNTPSENESINVDWPERYVSLMLGARLAFSGIRHLFSHPFTSILKVGAGGYLFNRGISGHCALYSRIGKDTPHASNVNIRSSFILNKPRQEMYAFWRRLDNLPLFMKHLERVEILDDRRSHWVLGLPAGAEVSWDAEIVNDVPNEVIGWNSLPGSMIDNAGKVTFTDAEDGRGTEVNIVITYQAPVGGIGSGIAHILSPVFKNMVESDIQNFKQYMDVADIEDSSVTPSL